MQQVHDETHCYVQSTGQPARSVLHFQWICRKKCLLIPPSWVGSS